VTVPAPIAGRRSVIVGLWVAIAQTVALAVAAALTGSAAMKTQTATNLADVAVGLFLLIGVISGDRPADDAHPLGYGRERFFWSFIAAVGIFIGGLPSPKRCRPPSTLRPLAPICSGTSSLR
jgi:divalent metal cation (Fe/Co/Zn/Cd) transporter